MIQLRALGPLDLTAPDSTGLSSILTGPKRLALLTYLVIESPGSYHRRDILLALLWPESNDRQARGSLRSILYILRKHLGHHIFENSGADQIRIAPDTIWCDVIAFREAVRADDLARAHELYRGDLLEGFFVSGAPAFEEWLARERESLNRDAIMVSWRLAEEAEARGDTASAIRYAHHAANLGPFDERTIRRLIELLDRLGDRAGALSAYDSFAEHLRSELLGEPAPETVALIESIRERRHLHSSTPIGTPPPPGQAPTGDHIGEDPGVTTADQVDQERPARGEISALVRGRGETSRGRWLRTLAASIVVLLGLTMGFWAREGARGDRASEYLVTLAIGEIETSGEASEANAAAVLPGLLATNLARAQAIRIFSWTHLIEMNGSHDGETSPTQAAANVGADELIQGTLIRREDGILRLDLRRVDLQTGEISGAYSVEGTDPFTLVDRATAIFLESFGLTPPATGIAEVSTHSLLAYRFYEEGLRAYVEGDNRSAERLLTAALEEDSTFAMAAYYRAQSNRSLDHEAFHDDLYRAARLADNATDLERLRILAAWAQAMDEPIQLLYADTLVRLFPHQPEGHLYMGKALLWGGDFLAALPHLNRALELDSISLHGSRASCLACDAIGDVIASYILADSLPAAERTARRWVELQPSSARAWHALGSTLEYQGHLEEALLARNRAADRRSGNPRDILFPAVLALRAGDFARADRILAALDGPGTSLVQQNVLWYRVLSLRYQGRLEEALPLARRYTLMLQEAASTGHSTAWPEILEAIVLTEMGRGRESAELWEGMAEMVFDPASPARSARHRAWTLTHAATALATIGASDRLSELAVEIERLGAKSAFGRDPRLHHYVRGLALALAGDTAGAVSAYRRALFSTTAGFARINLELGRSLLALGKPFEAIEILSAALRGPLDSGNLYTSRTEIHEALALAWEAAGQPDSAATHYRWISGAWGRGADPSESAFELAGEVEPPKATRSAPRPEGVSY